MRIRRSGWLLMLLVVLNGCGILSRPKNAFYSLETLPPAAPGTAALTGTASGTPIGIDGIELPPGFDRRGIVVRGANHKFEVRGTHQWASSLEDMVLHTLAFDLAGRLPNGMVILPGQAKPAGPMRSIFVVFEDLAPGPDGVFVLDARWVLAEQGRPEITGHERITVQLASSESASIAAAMSSALATLADRIVAAV
jgi:uncharacterized lipoprotein YmbA